MEVQTQREFERRIARYLIERRAILIPEDALWQLFGGNGDALDSAIERLPLYRVYSGAEDIYMLLPQFITRGKDVQKAVEIVGVLVRAVDMSGPEDLGVSYDAVERIIGNIVYDEFAAWYEKADLGLAWYHTRLAREYKVYDELVDRFDYGHSYTGPRYYRAGEVWLAEVWNYCNYDRWGNSVGIQKCVEYSYVDGPE